MTDLKQLQDRVEENKDEEAIRRLKKERDSLAMKTSEMNVEIDDVRRDVDHLQKERQELMWTHTKEIEEERTLSRAQKVQTDSVTFKSAHLEKENIDLSKELDSKRNEVNAMHNENDGLGAHIKKLEQDVNGYRQCEIDAKEALIKKEEEMASKLSKATHTEKSKVNKLTLEVSELKKELSMAREVPIDTRELNEGYSQLDRLNEMSTAKHMLEMKVSTLTAELQRVKDLNAAKNADLNEKDIQANNLQSRISSLNTEIDTLKAEIADQARKCSEAKDSNDATQRKNKEVENNLAVSEAKMSEVQGE